MKPYAVGAFVFLLLVTGYAVERPVAAQPHQEITLAPVGPFHVDGNRILDAQGRAFLMRGTQLTDFHVETAVANARSEDNYFGPHSATTLTAIRLRFNMNTVRVPINVEESNRPEYFDRLAELVRRANDIELLPVLAARGHQPQRFWKRAAALFKDNPNVMFDVGSAELVEAVRAAGATQPVVVDAGQRVQDANVIFAVAPQWTTTRTDADRDAQFGLLAKRAPVVATGWDLKLDDEHACQAIPADPTAAMRMVEASLAYYDAHAISWTASTYEAGKLIKDYSLEDATSLENGWTCGKPTYPAAGMGRTLEAHLRAAQERGLFVVSTGGGPDLARGGIAIAYGPVMAEHDGHTYAQSTPPTSFGKIKVEIKDALGVSRLAGILWASEGWGQVNYIVPEASAVGPGRMTIVRDDGSRLSANITIADTAPGFWTNVSCRGPARGAVVQTFADGRHVQSDASSCANGKCVSVPIEVRPNAKTTVRLSAGGIRHARSAAEIEVLIGGTRVPVVSYGPWVDAGMDQVTIEIPATLRGKGDLDLIARVRGRVSNAVRIRIGASS